MKVFYKVICKDNPKGHIKFLEKSPKTDLFCHRCGGETYISKPLVKGTVIGKDGKPRPYQKEGFKNWQEAETHRKEMIGKVAQNEPVLAESKTKLDDVADLYFKWFERQVKKEKRSQKTLDMYRQRYDCHIKPAFGNTSIGKITRLSIKKYMADREDKPVLQKVKRDGRMVIVPSETRTISLSSIDKEFATLSAILSYAKNELEIITNNPASGIEKNNPDNERTVYLPHKEMIDALIKECSGNTKKAVIISLYTGLRKAACLSFNRQSINLTARQITAVDKGRKKLYIEIFSTVFKRYLESWLRDDTISINGTLLPSKEDATEAAKSIDNAFDNAIKRVLKKHPEWPKEWKEILHDFHFHDLRRTFGTHFLYYVSKKDNLGMAIFLTSRALGHSDTWITKRYTQVIETIKIGELAAMKSYFDEETAIGGSHEQQA